MRKIENEIIIGLNIDGVKAKIEESRREIENFKQDANRIVENVNKEADKSWEHAVTIARASWNTLNSVLNLFGVSIPPVINNLISAIMAAIPTLAAIYTSEELSGVMIVQGILASASLGIAISNAITMQTKRDEMQEKIDQAMDAVNNASILIGVMNW